MRVRCIGNTGLSLPTAYLTPSLGLTKQTEFDLTIGKEYVVYALESIDQRAYLFICADSYTHYPTRVPAPLFETTDGTWSRYWETSTNAYNLQETAINEWISDSYFYERLVEGDAVTVSLFTSYKNAIDVEAY